jgi:hypothetical protein
MITGSGVLVCVFLKRCNYVKNYGLELSIDGYFCNNLELIVVILGISSHRFFFVIFVVLVGGFFVGLGWMVVLTHSHQYVKSLGFYGFNG